MSVTFKTGEGGALDDYYSHIFVKLPKQFKVAETSEKTILVNGEPVKEKVKPTKDGDYSILDIKCPANVDNFGKVTVDFLSKSGISIDYSKGFEGVSVSTSSEPNFIKSPDITIPDKPETTFGKPEELINSSILIRIPLTKKYEPKTKMSLTFPKDFTLPNHKQIAGVLVNGRSVSATGDDKLKTLTFVCDQPLSTLIAIYIPAESGITNPPKGNYSLSFIIGDETLDCGSFEIGESKIFIGDLAFSVDQAAMHTRLSFSFKPSSSKPLKAGDWFAVTFPDEVKLPDEITIDQIKVGGYAPKSIEKNKLTIKIVLSTNINANVKSLVDFGFEFVNPRHRQNFILKVESSLGDIGQSESVDLQPAPLQTKIYFKDPDQPNCDGWFNKPPILGFDCLNPDAKITFWFNGQPDKAVNYGGEARLMPGSQRATITWMSEYDGHRETEQVIDLKLDTVPPPLTVLSPKSDTTVTNKRVFTCKGERGFTEMLTNGDNTRYQVTDSVSIVVNGKETKLMDGEIYETADSGKIQYTFSKDAVLDEGINEIELIARDQACNETIITKKIILDTRPPEVEIIYPKPGQVVYLDEPLTVKIRTDLNSTVYINGSMANLDSEDGNFGNYSLEIAPEKGYNILKIEVTDQAGNMASVTSDFLAKKWQVDIVLTMGKTSWTVNGEEQSPLKVAPTNKFSDPKLKAINGTTFMPIAQIARLFNCMVEWDAKQKKVTLRQKLDSGDKVLELWLNKNTAKIDGKEVKYDAKGILFPFSMLGCTMLPFRWFGENLGASVVYDVKTKQITLTYPK